jgi:hypothetical protein
MHRHVEPPSKVSQSRLPNRGEIVKDWGMLTTFTRMVNEVIAASCMQQAANAGHGACRLESEARNPRSVAAAAHRVHDLLVATAAETPWLAKKTRGMSGSDLGLGSLPRLP